MTYTQTELRNGLRLASCFLKGMDSVAIGVWTAAGGRYERKKQSGISHFIEHLLFKGTRTRSGIAIKKSIEGIGGSLNGFTSEEITCFLVKILSKHAAKSIEILSDMVQRPLLKKSDVEKEKGVIAEEIKMGQDVPSCYVHEVLDRILWPGHPLGRPIIGSYETVTSFTKTKLASFRRKYYTSGNMWVVSAGALEHGALEDEVKKGFARCARGRKGSFPKAAPISLNKPVVALEHRDVEQVQLALGMRGYSRKDPRRFALKLLSIILGANMSSRLFQELREKQGLAYDVHTKAQGYNDVGVFTIVAGIERGKLGRVMTLIAKELKKIREKGVGKDELIRAKEFYAGQFLMDLEDNMSHMVWLGEQVTLLGKSEAPHAILENIEKVAVKDIKKVARELFDGRGFRLAAVGPVKDEKPDKIERLLGTL